MTRSLADVIDGRSNNFDLIRLGAALAVMFGHSFWIQPSMGRIEPILAHTGLEYTGSLAVYTFFLISGMLVTASYVRQKSALKFATLRAARIYPALFVCVLLSAYVLYPALSTKGVMGSLASTDAWDYFARNAALFRGTVWVLPGLFEDVALKGVVNGSLWTLPLEVKCYVLVFGLGILGLLRWRWAIIVGAMLALAGIYYVVSHGAPYEFISQIANKPTGYSFYPACFFVFGMMLYAMRRSIPIYPLAWLVMAISYIAVRHLAVAQPVFYLTVIYGILWLAHTPLLHRFSPKADLSYGIYLWAFPMQQIVASIWPHGDNLICLFLSVPMTLALAFLSWHAVEKPAMKLARSWASAKPALAHESLAT
jgi:peptidoglycan/LPS O-acetylase OafA/YrhL